MMPRAPLTALLIACAALALPSAAATITWTGAGATHNWSDTGNWQGGVVPGAADRAAFVAPVSSPLVTVDAPVTLTGIDFSGDGSVQLSGSLVTLTGATPLTVTSSTVGTFTLNTGVTFTASGPTISVAANGSPGPALRLLQGATTFSGGSVQVQGGTAPWGLVILANVRETAATSFLVSGHAAYFQGNNTITGPVTNTADSLGGSGVAPFGAASVVMQQGVLTMVSASGGSTLGALTLQAPTAPASGTLVNSGGPLRINGTVNTASHQSINAQDDITLKGKLAGNALLEILGAAGQVTLNGSGGSFSGILKVDSGGTLVFGANSAVAAAAHVDSAGGSIVVGSTNQTISEFTCTGPLEIDIGRGSLAIAGPIANTGCALTLNVPPSVSPAVGTTYTLVYNGTSTPIPPFASLPDGASLNVNGATMKASYRGGVGGLDLVLTGTSFSPPSFTDDLQDMWWGGIDENGWGLSIIQHGDTLFGALYVYDGSGNPVWLVMPGGSWDVTHRNYTGSLYEPVGSPFYAYDASRFVPGAAKGTMTLTFVDANNAIMSYTIGGFSAQRSIQREIFGSGTPGVDYSDLWWGGSTQNGWGITILQQGMTLFPVWFTYDSSGSPLWYVMPTGSWNAAGDTYAGPIYRTTSSPWLGTTSYDPTKLSANIVGSYSIKFSGSNAATFTYTADGHSGSMALVREPF